MERARSRLSRLLSRLRAVAHRYHRHHPCKNPLDFLELEAPGLRDRQNGHTIQANVAPGSFAQIGPNRYELKQFHFHRPGEHAVNGKRTAMEAHFVHANEQGKLAVLGVLIVAGPRNPLFAEIMKVAPSSPGEAKLKGPAYAQALLPRRGGLFFRYEGSLTTPPCAETVEWNVYLDPVAVAQADIDAFAKIFANNSRPLQPANRRFILRSF